VKLELFAPTERYLGGLTLYQSGQLRWTKTAMENRSESQVPSPSKWIRIPKKNHRLLDKISKHHHKCGCLGIFVGGRSVFSGSLPHVVSFTQRAKKRPWALTLIPWCPIQGERDVAPEMVLTNSWLLAKRHPWNSLHFWSFESVKARCLSVFQKHLQLFLEGIHGKYEAQMHHVWTM
jgi:hypothetical protein